MTYAEIAKSMPDDYEARKKDKLRYRWVHRHSNALYCGFC